MARFKREGLILSKLSKRQTVSYLAFLILVWGVNWPLSKAALQFSPPLLFAGLRTLLGGLILCAVAAPRWRQLRLRSNGIYYAAAGVLNITLYYGLQTVGLQYMPAGLFSAIVFLQPVLLGIAAWLWLGEGMHGSKLAGLLVGFAGVAVISVGSIGSGLSLEGVLLALASALSWCIGTVYMKRVGGRVDIVWMTAMQLLIGSVLLFASGAAASESYAAIRWTGTFWLELVFISVFVIALGWLAFFTLVGSGQASTVGVYTFLIPVVALIVSVLFMGEQVTMRLVAGLVLVLASIVLVNRRTGSEKEKTESKPAAS
ncbi:Uncharacterized transporter YvbV [Paenibacillus sp. P22]|nr:Uncharacterized transporter YvbV [Paenibacillus sp. P22]